MINWIKAFKLVVRAEQLSQRQSAKIRDLKVGVHLANPIDGDAFTFLTAYYKNRFIPYRQNGTIQINRSTQFLQSGNELENNINGKTLDALAWIRFHGDFKRKHPDILLASASLMTLKSTKIFEVVTKETEELFDAWAINSHGPGYLWTTKRLSSVGFFWEWIKCTKKMLDFKDRTTKPVILTEVGCGEYHFALSALDVTFLYYLHTLIFQDRLLCMLYYNDDLFRRIKGHEVFY